ncbi:serine protease 56-like [Pollicipes pollicipes]|uniref:serine protease 56-like n=1 Tax=Pollicipes pollicipes TaxID=41117 RepID=UPI001884A74A|nr:serine protease 56-like [Pollicipes pollicipes]
MNIISQAGGRVPGTRDAPAAAKIVGGHRASARAWPWAVRLGIRRSGGKTLWHCGGTLITASTHNDLALLRLTRPVTFSATMAAACLPEPGERFEGRPVRVAGWGRQAFNGSTSESLLVAEVRLKDADQCETQYRTLPDFRYTFPGGFGRTKL